MSIDIRQLLSNEKILPFYAARKGLLAEVMSPIAVELHWTSDCNYNCMHCSYGSRRQAKGRLSSDQIQSVVDDLVSMKASSVYLSGGGEPTLIKNWDNYAGQLIDGGIEVALITNGVALSKSHLEVLRRMNYIAVSVYSTDKDEYHKITNSHFFDRQWALPELLKGEEGIRTIVGARCVLNKINYRNIVSIYLQAKKSGYDYIIFIPAVDYEERGVGLGSNEQKEILHLVSENRNLFDPKFTNAIKWLTQNVDHYTQEDYRGRMGVPDAGCSAIQIRANAFVNYCGGVWLCQPHIGNPSFSIGSLSNARFSEIWNSIGHQKTIMDLNCEFSAGRCRNCRSIAFNRAADEFNRSDGKLTKDTKDPFI